MAYSIKKKAAMPTKKRGYKAVSAKVAGGGEEEKKKPAPTVDVKKVKKEVKPASKPFKFSPEIQAQIDEVKNFKGDARKKDNMKSQLNQKVIKETGHNIYGNPIKRQSLGNMGK